MSNPIKYPQFNAKGEVTNEAASLDLVASPGTAMYLNIERITISVYRAAVGGGGIVRLLDTNGNILYTTNADGVKDIPITWGDEGLQIGPGVGIQLITANAQGEQASASCVILGHKTPRATNA